MERTIKSVYQPIRTMIKLVNQYKKCVLNYFVQILTGPANLCITYLVYESFIAAS